MKRVVLGQDDRIGHFVMHYAGGSYVSGRGVGIGLEENGKLLAGVLYEDYNGASVLGHVAALPGKAWLNREFLWICFAYPFCQLHVKKIIGLVGEKNEAAREFDENLGFVLETALKDAHPDGSLLVYSMTREQCRWLNIKLRKIPSHGQSECTAAG